MPLNKASQTLHIAAVAFNSMFLGEIVVPDWDMFYVRNEFETDQARWTLYLVAFLVNFVLDFRASIMQQSFMRLQELWEVVECTSGTRMVIFLDFFFPLIIFTIRKLSVYICL